MTTLSDLRNQLTAKGYQIILPTPEQQSGFPTVSLHLHPLAAKPVVLVGEESDGARDYQTTLVNEATKRK